ncbi:hypothetical protein [Paracoccus benzoatiresistens]|uniref:Sulfotransferase family protein n=1 Tax=Paracoccus benzoatiresistens TaxID=2997341 RepID=A0ABT4J6A5_9RHOB|nr:hypothetical protein [Paracoccus sp. EF6]MCZ0962439.1 hypothetical protein [Paracoccus sp. EF6]
MSRLIIHVGTHKTATTHIQDSFHRNRTLLRQHGVIYPQIGVAHGQHSLATAWVNLPAQYSIADPRQAWRDLAAAYGGGDQTVFVSSEELSRLQPTCVDMADLARLTQGFDDVRIICTLRNQAGFVQSIYQELSRGFVVGPWGAMFHRALEGSLIAGFAVDYNLLYDHLLTGFRADQIRFVSYDAAVRSERGILGVFLQEIGVTLDDDHVARLNAGRANVSLPPLANLLANEMSHPQVAQPQLVQRLCDCIAECLPPGTRTTIFSRPEMNRLRETFVPLNRRLLERIRPFQPEFELAETPENAPRLFYRNQLGEDFWLGTLRHLSR